MAENEIPKCYTKSELDLVEKILCCKNDDYYGILQIDNKATEEEIKKAYKNLAREIHPDKNSAPGSHEAIQKVFKAYKTLTSINKNLQENDVSTSNSQNYFHHSDSKGIKISYQRNNYNSVKIFVYF